jgi:hypothetical protein
LGLAFYFGPIELHETDQRHAMGDSSTQFEMFLDELKEPEMVNDAPPVPNANEAPPPTSPEMNRPQSEGVSEARASSPGIDEDTVQPVSGSHGSSLVVDAAQAEEISRADLRQKHSVLIKRIKNTRIEREKLAGERAALKEQAETAKAFNESWTKRLQAWQDELLQKELRIKEEQESISSFKRKARDMLHNPDCFPQGAHSKPKTDHESKEKDGKKGTRRSVPKTKNKGKGKGKGKAPHNQALDEGHWVYHLATTELGTTYYTSEYNPATKQYKVLVREGSKDLGYRMSPCSLLKTIVDDMQAWQFMSAEAYHRLSIRAPRTRRIDNP